MKHNSEALRVLHVLPNMAPDTCAGGAERMAGYLMVKLSEEHDVTALSLYELTDSAMEIRLRQGGVSLRHLGKRRGFDPKVESPAWCVSCVRMWCILTSTSLDTFSRR